MGIPPEIVQRINELPIERVAEELGLHVNRHKALCFMHEDMHPSLSFNERKNIFFCFVCNKGGGPIQLVQEYNGWSFLDACTWLCERFHISYSGIQFSNRLVKKHMARSKPPKAFVDKTQNKDIDVEIGNWIVEHACLSKEARQFLFEARKYKPEVVKSLRIGSISFPNMLKNRLISEFGEERCYNSGFFKHNESGWCMCFYAPGLLFPYYRSDGVLYSIQARYFSGAQRFSFPSNVRQGLYNAQILGRVGVTDPLFVSEGVTDCIALLSAGKVAVAFPSGSICHKEDIRLLANKRLFMYPDHDKTGEGLFEKLNEELRPYGNRVTRCFLPEGFKDYSEYYLSSQK